MNYFKSHKLIAFFLAVLMILPLIPVVDLTVYAEGTEDYSQYMGWNATFGRDYVDYRLTTDPSQVTDYDDWTGTVLYSLYGDYIAEDSTLTEEEINAKVEEFYSIQMVVTDYYVADHEVKALWVKVEAAPGYTLPAVFAENPWVFNYYSGIEGESDYPSIALVAPIEVPEGTVTIVGGSSVLMEKYEKPRLTAATPYGTIARYSWQIEYATDKWVDIYGENGASLKLSYGMVASILKANGSSTVNVRCKTTFSGQTVYSDKVPVTVCESSTYSMSIPRAFADDTTAESGSSTTKYLVTVYYYVADSTVMVREVYTMQFGVNEEAKTTSFPVPVKEGYTAYYFGENANIGKENGTVYTGDKYELPNFKPDSNMDLYVRYYPNENTQYKVEHYFQNANNDDYTIDSSLTETKYGTTDEYVPSFNDADTLAKDLESSGFYATPYKRETIASDGTTVIRVYYDRFMYMMLFDLGEGGFGVEPTYARHGVQYTVGEPKLPGYSFTGWTDWNGNTISKTTGGKYTFTMPAKDVTVKANWTTSTADYTIVYWRADPDDGDATTPRTYSYWGRATINDAVSGSTIYPQSIGANNPAEDYGGELLDISEAAYFSYDAEKTAASNPQSVVVKGDGTTTINVYYARKSYELRFYYARVNTSNNTVSISNYTQSGYQTNSNSPFSNCWNASYNGNSLPEIIDTYYTTGEGRSGYETITTTGWFGSRTTYNYYYLAFDAEYGANIEDEWPANSLGSLNNDVWNFGSWAAESGSEYRKKDAEHANIVGAYPYLTADLIVDPDAEIGHHFVAWWGQEGRSESQNDKVSEHYYHIYYEVLPGHENDSDAVLHPTNGKYYKLDRSLEFSCAHKSSSPTRVDAFQYDGYTVDGSGEDANSADNYDPSHGHYCNTYYYNRRSYGISFFNHSPSEKTFPTVNLTYEELLSAGLPEGIAAPYIPPYPGGLEADGYEFEGWYTTDQFLSEYKVDWTTDKMPAGVVTLYAHWQPVEHKIEFYFDETCQTKLIDTTVEGNNKFTSQVVLHNEYGVDPGLPGHPMEFEAVTWFYKDAEGNEKAFTFDMPVKHDMNLYPKWRTGVYIGYEVYFKYYDRETKQFTDIQVAAPIYSEELYGQTVTVDPKATEELYPTYQDTSKGGYFPMSGSHSIVMGEQNCSVNSDGEKFYTCVWNEAEGKHIFTFYYVNGPKVPYTVEYHALKADGTFDKILDTKQVDDNYLAKVVENAPYFAGYYPDAPQKTIYVVYGQENKIVFYYTPDANASFYRVIHHIKRYGQTEYTVYKQEEFASRVGDIIGDYPPLSIPGVTYEKTEIDPANKTVGQSVNGAPGLTVNLYYTETGIEVKYVAIGGGTVSPDSETISMIMPSVVGSTPTAKLGYRFDGWYLDVACQNKVDLNYGMIDSATNRLAPYATKIQEMVNPTFYAKFVEIEVEINYVVVGPTDDCGTVTPGSEKLGAATGVANGSVADPNDPTFKFVGWYSNAACTDAYFITADAAIKPIKNADALWIDGTTYYAKFEYNLTSLTISKTGWDSVDPNQTFIFNVSGGDVNVDVTIHGNGSVTIYGLTVGQFYTITEKTNWSWRYECIAASYSGTGATEASALTLDTASLYIPALGVSNNVATFTNNRKTEYWLDGDSWCDNRFSSIVTQQIN